MSCKEFVTILNHETDRLITNWLPICISGVTRYVTDEYTIDNTDWSKTFVWKLYKQWVNWSITDVAPAGIGLATEWYCVSWTSDIELLPWCEYQTHTLNPWIRLSTTATTVNYTALNYNSALTPLWGAYITKAIIDRWDWEYEIVNMAQFALNFSHTPISALSTWTYNAVVYIQDEEWNIYIASELAWSYNQTTNAVANLWSNSSWITLYRTNRNIVQVRNLTTNTITYTTDLWVATTITAWMDFAVNCNKPINDSDIIDLVLSNWQPVYEAVANPLATHTKTTGTNINIPAWFRSVSIVKTSVAWVVNIEWLPRIYTQWWSEQFWADEYIYNWQRRVLPAFTVTNTWGSTFNWIAIS